MYISFIIYTFEIKSKLNMNEKSERITTAFGRNFFAKLIFNCILKIIHPSN